MHPRRKSPGQWSPGDLVAAGDVTTDAESGRRGSNPRHPAWEAGALPTELLPRDAVQPTVHVKGAPEAPEEPQEGIEPSTARLRIECSTTELLWRDLRTTEDLHALARTRTATPFGTASSRLRVYQFHHQGDSPPSCRPAPASHVPTGATGIEPATSRVTVECSNQAELRPLCGQTPRSLERP